MGQIIHLTYIFINWIFIYCVRVGPRLKLVKWPIAKTNSYYMHLFRNKGDRRSQNSYNEHFCGESGFSMGYVIVYHIQPLCLYRGMWVSHGLPLQCFHPIMGPIITDKRPSVINAWDPSTFLTDGWGELDIENSSKVNTHLISFHQKLITLDIFCIKSLYLPF